MSLWRLDKFIASQTGLSRKEAKSAIAAGRVLVEGVPILKPEHKIAPHTATVELDGAAIAFRRHVYLMLNKPVGYVSSTGGRDGPNVLELVPDELMRQGLFPAGRLDKASEGMLILTDDGDFAHRLLSPRHGVPKRYYVEVEPGLIDQGLVADFADGVDMGEQRLIPGELEPIDRYRAYVTIRQGLYHQIRRMFAARGAKVERLRRVRIGGLDLDPHLVPGVCRPLTEDERALLLETGEPQNPM
jgi:16S rRNA pseudouridine516 synthase